METVRAAFGDQSDLRSRAFSLVGVVVRRGDPEFLNRIKRRGQHGSKGIPVGLVIHVHAVESNVALVAARAVDRAVARVLILDVSYQGRDDCRYKPRLLAGSATPGTLRPSSGICFTWVSSKELPIEASTRFNAGASLVTVTISVAAPTLSCTFAVAGVLTSSCRSVCS